MSQVKLSVIWRCVKLTHLAYGSTAKNFLEKTWGITKCPDDCAGLLGNSSCTKGVSFADNSDFRINEEAS